MKKYIVTTHIQNYIIFADSFNREDGMLFIIKDYFEIAVFKEWLSIIEDQTDYSKSMDRK
jgi:hypothetical protein